jgi:hypothetical protein
MPVVKAPKPGEGEPIVFFDIELGGESGLHSPPNNTSRGWIDGTWPCSYRRERSGGLYKVKTATIYRYSVLRPPGSPSPGLLANSPIPRPLKTTIPQLSSNESNGLYRRALRTYKDPSLQQYLSTHSREFPAILYRRTQEHFGQGRWL